MSENLVSDLKEVLELKEEIYSNKTLYKSMWDKGERYYELIKNIIPKYINDNILENSTDHKYADGGIGQGNYSAVPWVAIYNPKITEDTKDGYYIVILIHPEGKGIYLSLNQGWTKIKNRNNGNTDEAKKEALSVSKELSQYLINNEYSKGKFLYGNEAYDNNGYPMGYAHGSILYSYYPINNLNNDKFIEDLKKFVTIFDDLASKVTKKDYDWIIDNASEINELSDLKDIKEQNQNSTLTLEDAPSEVKIKRKSGTTKSRANDEDINNANKEKKLTGVSGEELALKYFKELIEREVDLENREEFYNMLDTSMAKNHGFGYDMIAFDPRNTNEPIKKYIEIKTTKSSSNQEPFYVSLNELYAMYENPSEYLILRIYDCSKNGDPRGYILDPYEKQSEFNSFEEFLESTFEYEAIQFKVFGKK